jgi:hypothetical protein
MGGEMSDEFTAALDAGTYFYKIAYVKADNRQYIIDVGKFTVIATV